MPDKTLRTAWFDCNSGISGDMILGALVDLGVNLKDIKKGLSLLDLAGYRLQARPVTRGLVSGTKVDVSVRASSSRGRSHSSKKYTDIKKLIESSGLSAEIKTNALEVFRRIGQAEARVHRTSLNKVHFHEVGAVDSIVDIVGGAIGMNLLAVDQVYASALNTGEGTVTCDHGVLPVPAPATLLLLKGIPCYSSGVPKELTTPTGAAMISYYAKKFLPLPQMNIVDAGYGAGDHVIRDTPNMLRIVLGETARNIEDDAMTMVETNIDDMNPEFYDSVMESLFKVGAVDVFFTPITMKKNRPAVKLTAIVPKTHRDRVADILFEETSTFGLRYYDVGRLTLDREIRMLVTPYGRVKIKIGRLKGELRHIVPEYEDCKKIARKQKRPVKQIYDEVNRLAQSVSWD